MLARGGNRYWVIDGQQEVKNWDKECKSCERKRAQPAVQIMAPRPKSWDNNESVCKMLC